MIYTLGHSTLTADDFLALVEPVQTIIDVRSHPGSVHPQFNKEAMELWLDGKKGYEWEPRMGGWRDVHLSLAPKFDQYGIDIRSYSGRKFPKQRIAAKRSGKEPSWTNVGLYDYSFFMTLPEFHEAAVELIERGKKEDVAIMCCEVLYWKCHRASIADYLYFMGVESVHLQPKITQHSKVIGNRIERYEPEVIECWKQWKEA